jgi:hypothetical protein
MALSMLARVTWVVTSIALIGDLIELRLRRSYRFKKKKL